MMLGGRSSWYVQVQACFISCAFDPRPSALSPVIKVLIQDFTQMTYRSNLSKMPSSHSYNPMCQTLFSHRLFLTYIVAGTIEIHDTIPQNA